MGRWSLGVNPLGEALESCANAAVAREATHALASDTQTYRLGMPRKLTFTLTKQHPPEHTQEDQDLCDP